MLGWAQRTMHAKNGWSHPLISFCSWPLYHAGTCPEEGVRWWSFPNQGLSRPNQDLPCPNQGQSSSSQGYASTAQSFGELQDVVIAALCGLWISHLSIFIAYDLNIKSWLCWIPQCCRSVVPLLVKRYRWGEEIINLGSCHFRYRGGVQLTRIVLRFFLLSSMNFLHTLVRVQLTRIV